MTLQGSPIHAFNPVYRCGAGKSTMRAAYRADFCLFQTEKGEIPCISAPKVLCCLYIAVLQRQEKRENKGSTAFRGAAAVTG